MSDTEENMTPIGVPDNAAAQEIIRLRSENVDLAEQIRVLTEKRLSNSEMVGNLTQIAAWVAPEIPEPEPEIPAEPEPEPEEVSE